VTLEGDEREAAALVQAALCRFPLDATSSAVITRSGSHRVVRSRRSARSPPDLGDADHPDRFSFPCFFA
jgi:hypothetical protein